MNRFEACTVVELYGVLDPATRDWTDGLLSNIFRQVNKPLDTEKDEHRYILFDGDVDPQWIENMNSVMDDNKLLTLANQERIRMQNHCSLLFEVPNNSRVNWLQACNYRMIILHLFEKVGDLQYASPATVSRAGMVYVDPKNLGHQPYMDKWIRGKASSDQEFFTGMTDKYVDGAILFIRDGMLGLQMLAPLKLIIPQTGLNMVIILQIF